MSSLHHYIACDLGAESGRVMLATLDELEHLTGRILRVRHIVGGGAKNVLLNQLAADATGRTVPAGPVEATALGHIPDLPAARRVIRESFTVARHEPRATVEWNLARDRFAQLPK